MGGTSIRVLYNNFLKKLQYPALNTFFKSPRPSMKDLLLWIYSNVTLLLVLEHFVLVLLATESFLQLWGFGHKRHSPLEFATSIFLLQINLLVMLIKSCLSI